MCELCRLCERRVCDTVCQWFPHGRHLVAEFNSGASARAKFTRHFFGDIHVASGIGCYPRLRVIPLIRKACLLDTTSKFPYSRSELGQTKHGEK